MKVEIQRTYNGILYWDVMVGRTLVARFERKWQAVEFRNELVRKALTGAR